MGVMDRARSKMPTGDGREWLDGQKDDLIREATPLAIVDVNYDQSGSKYGPRWVVAVEGFYDDVEVEGKLSFKANPTRNPMYEELQAMLDEDEQNGGTGLGPVCLVKGKTKDGNRFYTFADYDEDKGGPVEEAPKDPEPEAEAQSGRRRSRPPVEEQRPIERTARSVGQRERDEVKPDVEAAPEPKRGRGRPRGSTRERAQQQLADGRQQAQVPVTGEPGQAQATQAQEVTPQGAVGRATCPYCEQELTGRAFPSDDGGGPVLIHRCPKTQKPEVLPAIVE